MNTLLVILALSLIPNAPDKLRVTAVPPAVSDPDRPVTWRFTIENVSGKELPSAPVWFSLSSATIVGIEPDHLQCKETDSGRANQCTLPALAPGQSIEVSAVVQHPFRYGSVSSAVSVAFEPGVSETSITGQTYWLEFPVTTAADAGPGSLRQTILDINAAPECQQRHPVSALPCKAAFHITDPVPAEGWYTVRPATPLPALTAYRAGIDGSTQTAANTRGPAVALDGSALLFGNGITVNPGIGHAEIRGLAIGGFPWNGIFAARSSEIFVRDCYIGVDPTGQRANANGSRGIASTLMRGTIINNVISGNRRSGIFFDGEMATGPYIRNNRIGVAAHDDTPIGNGASGIFIGDFWGYYAYPEIKGNVIANNAHFGIALTANAPMLIFENTVRDNGMGGIDIGLDGPTGHVPGAPGAEGGVVPPPVILSATYANGVTTIKGYSLAGLNNRRQVLLYANSSLEPGGYAEGEQFLGSTPVQFREDTAFTFQYPGDLRGKYINGTSAAVTFWGWDEYAYTSSEFGLAIPVEEE